MRLRGSTKLAGWDEANSEDNLGALLEYTSPGDSLSFQAGVLDESAGFIGISPQGAFGAAKGRTYFGGLTVETGLGANWRARASAYTGRTMPELRTSGVVQGIGPVTSSSFGVSLEGRDVALSKDVLGFSLSQPLRVERGSAHVRLPVGRTPERRVLHQSLEVDLEPSARTLDFRLSYARPLGSAEIGMALGTERNAGHSKSGGDDLYGHLTFDLSF